MKMDLGLQVKLTQSLIMTPQLQQAIKLLQLSRYELEQLIDQSLVENPALESLPADDDEYQQSAQSDESSDKSDDESSDEWENVSEESYLQNELPDNNQDLSPQYEEWEDYIGESGNNRDTLSKNTGLSDKDQQNILENTVTGKESLTAHLLWQVNLSFEGEEEKQIAATIVSFINNEGYLTASVREIIAMSEMIQNWCKKNAVKIERPFMKDEIESFDLKYSQEKGNRRTNLAKKLIKNVRFEGDLDEKEIPDDITDLHTDNIPDHYCFALEKILKNIQQLDPSGVGARTIRECLLLQLEGISLKNTLPYKIAYNDFQNLIRNDIHRLDKKYNATFEEIQSACRIIRELEPKPGRPFSDDNIQYVIPDVFIYKRFGAYTVKLNGETLPKLRISPQYLEMAKQQHIENAKKTKSQKSEEDEDLTEAYLNEKIRAGEWLIKSIDQRQRTIYKVAESILKNQKDFFERGISELKPMILKVVADDIGVHESTVSRITNNKFVHTPQGIFELKFFFTSGVTQDDGDTISSKKIKDLISRLIQNENPKKPFTDHQLAIELEKTEKIKIARRTVAKYRESMNILPSNRRKRLF